MFALAAVRSAPPERIARYIKHLKALTPQSVQKPLEALMRIELKDAFVDGWLNRGRAEMLLKLLERRFCVPASTRKRVETCNNTVQIEIWFDRAISASSLSEVFEELQVPVSSSLFWTSDFPGRDLSEEWFEFPLT